MLVALLTLALAQDTWEKSEGELPPGSDAPVISCCGYAPALWRRMIRSVKPQLQACTPELLPTKLRVTLHIDRDQTAVRAEVDSEDAELRDCLIDALEQITWPGPGPSCDIRVVYPLLYDVSASE